MNVVISMSIIPSRLPCPETAQSVQSLRRQGLPLYVWIPEVLGRTGQEFDGHIPDYLYGPQTYIGVVKDKGSATKLLPALKLDNIDAVITADDDVWYGNGWADGLLHWAHEIDYAPVGYLGRTFNGKRSYNAAHMENGNLSDTDILLGTWGVLYPTKFFDADIHDAWETWPLNDDITTSHYLKERGIRRMVVPQECEIKPLANHEVDELWKINKHKNNDGLEAVGWW